MQLIDVPLLEYDDYRQKINFHLFTDIHMGAEGCDERQLERDVSRFVEGRDKGEVHIGCLGGDNTNAIGPKDKRNDATAIARRFKRWEGDDLFRQQVKATAKVLEPIAPWLIFCGQGNHEQKVSVNGEYNPAADLAEKLDIPYAGFSCGFRLKIQPRNTSATATITGLWHHGFGAARTKGGKVNLGEKIRQIANTDITLVGHVHEPVLYPEEELSLSRHGSLRLKAQDKLIVIGASYLKTYPTTEAAQTTGNYDNDRQVTADYGERFGYKPAVIGHVGFTIEFARQGKQRQTKVKLRMKDYR